MFLIHFEVLQQLIGDQTTCDATATQQWMNPVLCYAGCFFAGNEVLVAGPTAWGTELQLPDSWVEAIQAAQLPEEQPLMRPLEVSLQQQALQFCPFPLHS